MNDHMNTTHLTTYRALLAAGKSTSAACQEMMRQGLTLDQAAALSWQSTGQKAPSHAAWARGHYARSCGE